MFFFEKAYETMLDKFRFKSANEPKMHQNRKVYQEFALIFLSYYLAKVLLGVGVENVSKKATERNFPVRGNPSGPFTS